MKKIDTASIAAANSNDFDRADDFLCQWKDNYGDSATLRRLTSALKGIGRADIAATIGIWRWYSYSIETWWTNEMLINPLFMYCTQM